MDISLEKIDIIRERTGVSYGEAKEALEKSGGNVVDALIYLEQQEHVGWTENIGIAGNEVIEKLKRIIQKGNVTKIILKKDEEVLLNIPVTAGAIGAILAPMVAILGTAVAVASRVKIEIVRDDGQVVDLNEYAEDKVNNIRNKFTGKRDNEQGTAGTPQNGNSAEDNQNDQMKQ